MAGFRWSDKKVSELLEEMSNGQKNFKTKPSGRAVKNPRSSYKYYTHGYFHIGGAYGGVKLEYVLPYSSGVSSVTSGYVGSGKLADYLLARGADGLARDFKALEKRWIPTQKAQFEREGKPRYCRRCNAKIPEHRIANLCDKCLKEVRR